MRKGTCAVRTTIPIHLCLSHTSFRWVCVGRTSWSWVWKRSLSSNCKTHERYERSSCSTITFVSPLPVSPGSVLVGAPRKRLVTLSFPGLTADGRVLIDKARVECQSHRLTVEDPVTVEYITRHIAGIQQVSPLAARQIRKPTRLHFISKKRYTQSGGVRPFGISTLIVGFDPNETIPRLYQTEPSGIYSAWKVCHIVSFYWWCSLAFCRGKANAIGRSSKTVREFLEKNHKDDMTRDESIKLTVKSLLEVVQTGAKNIEISVMEGYGKVTVSTHNVCSSPPRLHT